VAARRSSAWPLAGILLLGTTLDSIGLWWGLPNQTDAWAADELSPWDVFESAEQRFSGGWFRPYPPLHYYVLALVQLPVWLAIWWGATTLTDPATYTVLFVLVRLTSVAMATATVWLVYACGRQLGGEGRAAAAALMTALVLPLVYYAKVANVDGPAVFWSMLALWCCLRALETGEARYYVGLGAAAACAVATKDQTFALVLAMPLGLALVEYRRRRMAGASTGWRAAFGGRRVVGAWLVAVGLLILLENPFFNWDGLRARLDLLPELPRGWEQVPNTPAGHVRLAAIAAAHVRFSLGWPFFVLVVAGIVWTLRRWREERRALAVLAPMVSYWVAFVMPVRYVFDRYLLPVTVMSTLFGGVALEALWRWRRWRPLGPLLAAASVAYTLAYTLSVDWLMLADARYAAERWLAAHVPRGARIAAVGFQTYLPRLRAFEAMYLLEPTAGAIEAARADYVVVTSAFGEERFAGRPDAVDGFSRLRSGALGYVAVFRHRGRPWWNFVRFDGIASNLDKINPEIVVYARRPLARAR